MRANEFITPIKKEFQDPADDPNAGFDKEFKQDSIFNQMGKILIFSYLNVVHHVSEPFNWS